MATQIIPIPKANDLAVLTFYEKITAEFGVPAASIWINGVDSPVNTDSAEFSELKRLNGYSIRQVTSNRAQSSINYVRNRNPERFASPDIVEFANNNSNFSPSEAIKVTNLISNHFSEGAVANSQLIGNPEAFAAVIASHQEIISRLEQNLEKISARFAEERLKIQSEQDTFIRQKQDEFSQREAQLLEDISKEKQALAAREKDLDDRTNTHARRGIRADMKKRLQEHATKFTLTDRTQHLRWPIHAVVIGTLWVLVAAIVYYTHEHDLIISGVLKTVFEPKVQAVTIPAAVIYPPLIKISLLSVAALGILTWYIRWMNRWFDQHAEAEFNLKQFELDVDRASWVVETAMEWRSSQHGVLPSHLLESITRNLFASKEQRKDESIHPADYLASAIFGNASKARVSVDGTELELDRKGIRALKKDEVPR